MLDMLRNNSLVLAPNNIKNKLLKELSSNGKILNLKFMTLEEFCDNYFGKVKPGAIYFLMKKYDLEYDVAREYLSNIFYDYSFLNTYYEDLVNNDLIEYNLMFKDSLKSITCFYESVDPFVKGILDKYDTVYIERAKGDYKPLVYGFTSQTLEIVYVASSIVSKLGEVSIDDICLIIPSEEYYDEVKRIFKWFNIPINISSKKNIFGTSSCQKFLSVLKEDYDINEALESINKDDIYNKIIDVLNKYCFDSFDDISFRVIENELRHSSVRIPLLDNAVNVVNINDISDDKHYYLMGFNQGIVPRIYHDDRLIKDKDRVRLGLLTSYDRLKDEKKSIVNYITSVKNLVIIYKEKDNYNSYFPSSLIEELGLDVLYNPKISLNYSNFYNKLFLGDLLDRYYKYNEVNDDLGILLNTYGDDFYKNYDNKFSGVDKLKLYNYLGGKLNLSYSSLNNYFHCAFRYYINNILKLDPYEETFSIMIGNLFHKCLSCMYNDGFDLRKEYDLFLSDKELNNKEKFFAEKLYKDLEFIIDTIRGHDSLSKLGKVCTEKYIAVEKKGDLHIKFLGFVDKIKYKEDDDKVLCAIIDYKTGTIKTSLDNINYGFNLQLPVYIYLADKAFNKKVEVIGFYLQKLLPSREMDKEEYDLSKLKLEGYSIDDEKLLRMFDESYENSEVIKGMKTTSKGFSANSKVLSFDDIVFIKNMVDKNIDLAVENIEKGKFDINPKRIDDKLVGCEFCKYKDLCFRKEEDIVNLEGRTLEDILGSDDCD